MKTYRLLAAAALLAGFAGFGHPALADGASAAHLQKTAALAGAWLERLPAGGQSMLHRVDSSCTTTCGSGPDGTCSKSCPPPQNCLAHCEGGKATCECR